MILFIAGGFALPAGLVTGWPPTPNVARLSETYFPFSGRSASGRAIRGALRSDKGPV